MGMKLISIPEIGEERIPRDQLEESTAVLLHRYFSEKIRVEFPSALNGHNYVLRVKDGIGQLALPERLTIQLVPNAPLVNIFQMIEYTYKIRAAQYLEGIFCMDSLTNLFDQLALDLSKRVHDRVRKGLYQDYITKIEDMNYLRGRLDQVATMRNYMRGDTRFTCEYQEHTPDIEENTIVAWTLFKVSKFGIKDEYAKNEIRKAYHVLRNTVTVKKHSSQDCLNVTYNRLNEDYRYIHRLCQFFLDQVTTETDEDKKSYIPITLSMKVLFRSFVAEWIRSNLPRDLALRVKERTDIEPHWGIKDEMDIVIYDADTSVPKYLVSTIYNPEKDDIKNDIYRGVSLAVRRGCNQVVLVYPHFLENSVDTNIGKITIKAIPFPLEGDLNKAGRRFLEGLFRNHKKKIVVHSEENLFSRTLREDSPALERTKASEESI
jgi:5-methylcytosine-specific restriction enzyme subunit McrC